METSLWGSFIVGTLRPDVSVARFACTNLDAECDGPEAIEECEVFQELEETVLGGLAVGQTLVLNLALIESAAPALVRYLLKVRQVVQGCEARLILCRPGPVVRQLLDDTQTLPLFQVACSEEEAVRGLTETWGGVQARPRYAWP